MRTLLTLIVAAVIVAAGAVAFVYSGLYDVSARVPHSGPVQWLLSKTSDAAVARRASAIDVPDLAADALALAGINDYQAMCAGCHGIPGQAASPLARGLNPPAPDLSVSAQSMSPAELFWVTKHGIKMTGMPAWGASHDDASLWPVVAFMTRLPVLDADAYQALLASATGSGHHSEASDQGATDHGEPDASHGSHDHTMTSHGEDSQGDAMAKKNSESDRHHDGHDHEH
ncbi:MAG: cytochrome c [Silicimonas sp.]|nr:cytochrome c [Silicimonas sp.]